MGVLTSTGTVFSVAVGEPLVLDGAGFLALDYTEVAEVTDIPEYGPSAQVVEHNPLKTGVTQKYKGFINYGQTALQLGRDILDAGQAILAAAVDGATKNTEHSFRIDYQDGTSDFFTGKVFSSTTNPSSANSIVGRTAVVEINSPIVRVTGNETIEVIWLSVTANGGEE